MELSEDLRSAEAEVDIAYRENSLVHLSRPEAMWRLLAACEEQYMRRIIRQEPLDKTFVDSVINLAKWPLRWLWRDCRPSGTLLRTHSPDDHYDAAMKLLDLGRSYEWFECAFLYGHKGRLHLEIEQSTIRPTWEYPIHVRYDAYDRLRDEAEGSDEDTRDRSSADVMGMVAPTVRLSKDGFSYALDPRVFKQAYEGSADLFQDIFQQPQDWRLPAANFAQYCEVLKGIWVISYIHFCARIDAARKGCCDRGYSRAIVVMKRDELIARLCRYLSIDRSIVSSILEELTFGGRGMHSPDIALQPVVHLDSHSCAWAPSLVINSSLERNLLVLLNRLPHGRTAYSHQSKDRETQMRESLRRDLADTGLRFWSGNVANWGAASDLDLAIIDDRCRCCLLLELKAFLAPADPREVHEKAIALEKGVQQIDRRREALCSNRESLNRVLHIDNTFLVYLAVASESSVGCGMARLGESAVVRSSHLVERIKSESDLRRVCKWLSERDYLPSEGRDYEEVPYPVTVGRWTLEWYQIKTLTDRYC